MRVGTSECIFEHLEYIKEWEILVWEDNSSCYRIPFYREYVCCWAYLQYRYSIAL